MSMRCCVANVLLAAAAALLAAGCRDATLPVPPPAANPPLLTPTSRKTDFTPVLTPPTPDGIHLTDVTAGTGITFVHTDGGAESLYIVQTVVAGLALFDYDNDGLVDIYFLNGAPTPGSRFDVPPHHELWRNLGGFRFADVTDEAGVGDTGYGLGVVSGDYDNDGDQDLYVSNFGPSVLYRNNGDGTFTSVTEAAGVARSLCGAGAAFLDIEGDGDLDLYAGNYVDFAYERNVVERIGDRAYSAGPLAYRSQPDLLFRNNGDGTFTDSSQECGIAETPNATMGLIAADYDGDGDSDIFVCCDNAANQLWRNDGRGRFEEFGFAAGVAFDLDGGTNGNMGVTCEDYDNDGRLDFYVTTFSGELSALYRNTGGGFFTDMARPSQSAASTISHAKWGTTLADFDHDGDRDLFVACGHFWIDARYVDDRTDVKVPNAMLENLGSGKFRDISRQCGDGLGIVASSKGAGFDDLDNDGDLDVVILNANDKPSILRSDLNSPRRSLQIVLRGRTASREGVGARVKVVAGPREQISEVHRGQGYQSGYGNRLHFGLGEERVTRIEVRWIGGGTDVIENPPEAAWLLIDEGGGAQTMWPEKQ
jgi:hypothetical protein